MKLGKQGHLVQMIFTHVLKKKKTKIVLSEQQANILRETLDTSIIPQIWKKANTPIFKKWDKSVISNYRPISLTSLVGQVFEYLIANHIYDHLERYTLINGFQFMKGKSCLFFCKFIRKSAMLLTKTITMM